MSLPKTDSRTCAPMIRLARTVLVACGLGFILTACDRDIANYELHEHEVGPAGEAVPGQSPRDTDSGAEGEPLADGIPLLDTAPAQLAWDVFGSVGARYWFLISDAELERMNQGSGGVSRYWPGGGVETQATFADHLVVTTPGDDAHSADFGKVQLRFVGESTDNPLTIRTLPNLRVDADEFVRDKRIGGVEHLRFNNALNGGIFRENLTLDLYRKLGYPAPLASYAWVSTNVWGPEVAVPYILVEPYKRAFCNERESELAGGCVNMWEVRGDFDGGVYELPESCQFSSCDTARVSVLSQQAQQTPLGPGYESALDSWIDWQAFHEFQCLSWIFITGDDAVHGSTNVVLAERADGKFQYLPYSVDVSFGSPGYRNVPLAGSSALANGCQSDPACWANTLGVCEALVEDFAAADPAGMLDVIHDELEAQGMLRAGDESRYQDLRSAVEQRLIDLPIELELNR